MDIIKTISFEAKHLYNEHKKVVIATVVILAIAIIL
jgi:hypothetical protein|tara:strand:+ start:1280 stop:1387 length:108 start_codon:yes stop_codon:yes gene_type:complete